MKLLKFKIEGLMFFEPIEFDFLAQQRVLQNEINYDITRVHRNVDQMHTIALIGLNASGKTILLKLIESIFYIYKDRMSLNAIVEKNYLNLMELMNDTLVLETYWIDGTTIYKIESTIEKKEGKLYFKEEIEYSKEIKNSTKRDLFMNFEKNKERTKLSKDLLDFMKEDETAFNTVSKSIDYVVRDTLLTTNSNNSVDFDESFILHEAILNLLDPRIEYLKQGTTKDILRLKFYNSSEKMIEEIELEFLLSSGTLAAYRIFKKLIEVLRTGGILLIDEIENHLNQQIVKLIIGLFHNPETNKKGALLLFSTHYAEILDVINRQDSVYVLGNKLGKIEVNNFVKFEIRKRNDIKKSVLFQSGALQTAIQYEKIHKIYVAMD